MDKELISKALSEAYSLICSEYQSVCDDDLMKEYETVVVLLEKALEEVK